MPVNIPDSELPVSPSHSSQLFILRIWREELGDEQFEWRAYVRHIPSGEARYIRSWQGLEAFLSLLLMEKRELTE